jgi:RsiW-degrading membrane proteinase PrsW (M82 family)
VNDIVLTLFLALTGGFLPAIVWLWFWLGEDEKRPEPTGYILQAFLVGGLTVLIAFFLERPLLHVFGEIKGTYIDWPDFSWLALFILVAQSGLIISWSAIEEVLKFLAARLTVFEHRAFDEPIDAMIYLITVALGFAAIENTLFLFDTLTPDGSQTYFLLTGHLRFLGATVIHTVSSAVVGGFFGLAFYKSKFVQAVMVTIGLVVAIVLHASFNFFIINNEGNDVLSVLITLWAAAIVIILLFEKVKTVSKPL